MTNNAISASLRDIQFAFWVKTTLEILNVVSFTFYLFYNCSYKCNFRDKKIIIEMTLMMLLCSKIN